MRKSEKKILQLAVILILLKLFDFILTAMLHTYLDFIGIEYNEEIYGRIRNVVPLFLSNLIFSTILFIYAKNELKNRLIIPALSLFSPLAAIVFYFIETELILKRK